MNFTQYQNRAAETAIYDRNHSVIYPALGLASEAGEVAGKIKKRMRDNESDLLAIAHEIGDVLWYVAALCRDLNLSMEEVALLNLKKLHERAEKGTLKGNGDER